MIRLFMTIAVLAVIIAALQLLANNAGEVSLSVAGFDVNTSVTFLTSSLIIICFASFLLGQLISFIRNTPKRVSVWQNKKRQKEGVDAFVSAFQAVKLGDLNYSKKMLKKAESLLDDKRLPLFLKAEVQHMAGDQQEAENTFLTLEQSPETALMGQLGLLEIYKENHAYEALKLKAMAVLDKQASNLVALNALWDATLHLGQLDDALKMIHKMRRLGAKDAEYLDMSAASIYVMKAKQSLLEDKKLAEKHLKKALDEREKFAPAAMELAKLYEKQGKQTQAEKVLHSFLLHTFNDKIFDAWLEFVKSRTPKNWSKTFAQLEKQYIDGLEGNFIRAKCLEQQGSKTQAQALLIQTSNIQPNRKMYLWMAKLEDSMAGKVGAGYDFMREALSAPEYCFEGTEDFDFFEKFKESYKRPITQISAKPAEQIAYQETA